MPVHWSHSHRANVEHLIDTHPVTTSDCAVLGRKLLPIARQHETAAHAMVIRADTRQSRFACIKPRHPDVKRHWYHHVTIAVDGHGVDALSGADGTPLEDYLHEHFVNVRDLWLDDTDPDLQDPLL